MSAPEKDGKPFATFVPPWFRTADGGFECPSTGERTLTAEEAERWRNGERIEARP